MHFSFQVLVNLGVFQRNWWRAKTVFDETYWLWLGIRTFGFGSTKRHSNYNTDLFTQIFDRIFQVKLFSSSQLYIMNEKGFVVDMAIYKNSRKLAQVCSFIFRPMKMCLTRTILRIIIIKCSEKTRTRIIVSYSKKCSREIPHNLKF